MKLLLSLLLFSVSAQAANVSLTADGKGSPITSHSNALDIYLTNPAAGSNPAAGTTGTAVPSYASYTGAKDGSGNLVGLLTGQQTMANSLACVLPSNQSAIPVTGTFWQATQPVSGTFWQATQPVSAASLPLPTGASTSAKQPALGTAGTASTDVITVQGIASMTALKVDGSGVTQPVSGTFWQATQPVSAASLPLPTGASTSALQTAGNTSLATIATNTAAATPAGSNIIGKVGIDQTTPGTTNGVQVNAALPAGTNLIGKFGIDQTTPGTTNGVQVNAALPAGTNTIGAVTIAPPVTGSGSAAAATVSTVITLTAPANATGFILQNLDTSTANIRWAVGRTATTTLGQQLQPGRDTGFVPIGANVSIIAESGTQGYDVQWIAK